MNITEKDLFLFIFYPDKISDEKRLYIENNESKFKDELSLLKEINNFDLDSISDDVMSRIMNKVNSAETEYELNLIKLDESKNEEFIIISAESPTFSNISKTETFQDIEENFTIKVLTTKDENQIYIFAKESNLSKIKIRLEPSNQEYNFEISKSPLLIRPKQNIEKIYILIS